MRSESSSKARLQPLWGGLLLAAAIALAGCDSGSDESSTGTSAGDESTPSAKTVARAKESGDQLPKLDRGWVAVRSRSGGFVLARPPGWSAQRSGSALTVLAPDELVAVTVSADRTPEGLAIPPGEFATRAARSLPGFKKAPKPSPARPFEHRYKASQVVARTKAKNGIPQELRVVVIRRNGLVTFTAVLARNAKRHDAEEAKEALEIVSTVRSRPSHEEPKKAPKD